jgi:hypothetical protein
VRCWVGAATLILAAGCQFPPGAPQSDLAPVVGYDGGDTQDLLTLPQLDGNVLPLDGGPPGGFAHLVFNVSDGETQLPMPARVIFRPPPGAGFADSITSGTPDPLSPGGATAAVVGPGVLGSPEGVLLVSGLGVVPVPAGTYKLFVTRGPEWEAADLSVTVDAGEVRAVNVFLDRSVDTRGWLAADLHVHVSRSKDSTLLPERRVISEVSNGVELVVSTDHDVNSDLGPSAASLGYGGDTIVAFSGNEYTFNPGHAGVYPVPFNANAPNGGAVQWQSPCAAPITGFNCMDHVTALQSMHDLSPGITTVTINHPFWPMGDLGYFTNLQWGYGTANPPPTALPSAGNIDSIEVLSGYQARVDVMRPVLQDWFWLVGSGFRITALGSSDTHRINWVRAGWPRSWIRLPNDMPGDTTAAALSDAIKHQRVIASTGPFVTVAADGAQIGDMVVPKTAGQVTVTLDVDAPSWIAVDTVQLWVNGALNQTWAVGGTRPVFHSTFDVTLPDGGDAWIVAVASGQQPLPTDVVGEYGPAHGFMMTPYAITNPIFVDVDANGAFNPPTPPVGGPAPAKPLPPFRGKVPRTCDPSEIVVGEEPPLDAIHTVMPLLY